MQNLKTKALVAAAAFVLTAGTAFAKVDAGQAGKIGKELTPIGAETAGNADGTIPAWDGGITQPPAGYSNGMFHPDPYASEQPKFVIDGQNYKQYEANLTAGQIAMLQKYPSYNLPVYATHRSASFPARTYEFTAKNATTCELIADGEGVGGAGCAEGFPFPIPQNAYELMWNHKLKYKGIASRRWNNQVAPTAGGQYSVVRLREEFLGLYYKPGSTIESINNVLLYFFQVVEGPARLAGNVLLVHETLNQSSQPRQAWVYNPGQRRVRRAPNVAYDNPGTASDGLRTNDMTDMFNGAMDRFDWKVVGKRELYVPYNSYKAHSDKTTIKDLVKPGHLNPDYMRYELHRVWVVEATLKAGKRHINARRTFYFDEDSYQILATDHYDGRGQLWRVSEAHSINYYEVPTFWATLEAHYDLQSGRYLAGLLDNEEKVIDFGISASPDDYSPQSLRKRGIR